MTADVSLIQKIHLFCHFHSLFSLQFSFSYKENTNGIMVCALKNLNFMFVYPQRKQQCTWYWAESCWLLAFLESAQYLRVDVFVTQLEYKVENCKTAEKIDGNSFGCLWCCCCSSSHFFYSFSLFLSISSVLFLLLLLIMFSRQKNVDTCRRDEKCGS